jgi:hypothetical protein
VRPHSPTSTLVVRGAQGLPPAAVAAFALCLASLGCGGSEGVGDPSPAPAPAPVLGRYRLEVQPSPVCGAPLPSVSFLVEARAADTARYGGVQIVPEGTPLQPQGASRPVMQMELQLTEQQVRGGLGTIAEGVRSQEGRYVWLRLMGFGTVTRGATGAGEVSDGTMLGGIEFLAGPTDRTDGFDACYSLEHRWSLRAR